MTTDALPSTSAPMTATGRVGDVVPAAEETRIGHLIRAFFNAQDARSRTYERWNAAYGEVLTGATDEQSFIGVTTAVTAEMKKISEEILSIEEALKREERGSAAMLIRVVQQNERVRLEMTCALQVLKRAASRKAWAWQIADEDASTSAGDDAKSSLTPSWARTTHADGSTSEACPVGCACAAAASAPEPTEEEYVNAVSEATQTLESAFREINDAIEELRYELEDVDDDNA